MAERVKTTETWRVIVVRASRFSWHWSVDERRYNGSWESRGSGAALTRRGAANVARRRVLSFPTFTVERHEELIVQEQSYVPPKERVPAIEPTLVPASEGGES